MTDIRTRGLKEFVDRCRTEQVRGAGGPNVSGVPSAAQLENWVREHVTSNDPQPQPPASTRNREARSLRRVAFCNTKWPNLAGENEHLDAINQFDEVLRGLERTISLTEARLADSDPFIKIAALTQSRVCRGAQSLIRFLTTVIDAFHNRDTIIMNNSFDISQQTTDDFGPSSVEARALLWFYVKPRDLESKLI